MGRLMAAVYDRFMRASEDACLRDWRAELLTTVGGRVLEVGAGTGVTLSLYTAAVDRLTASEPDPHMRSRLARRVADVPPEWPVEVSDAAADALTFPDGAFDAVVCMLVLCSVPDQAVALAEMRRVLRPGGRLVFLEHVAADDRPRRLCWQRRLEPFWRLCAGNCHLTRRTERAIDAAGFELATIRRESMRKALPVVRPTIRGVAVRPSC